MLERVECAFCGAKLPRQFLRCPRCGTATVIAEPAALSPSFLSKWGKSLVFVCAGLSLILFVVMVMGRSRTAAIGTAAVAASLEGDTPGATGGESTQSNPPTGPVTSFDFDRAGAAAYSAGNFAGALDRFEQAVRMNPNDPRALNHLGQALVRVGRAQEALPYLTRATELNPSEWAPRFNLAHAYGALDRWSEAIPEYQKAAELFPDDYVTQYNLGLAFHKASQEEPAVAAFQRAINLAPGEPSFHLSLGISYERLNERAKAAQAYETYLAMSPSAPDAEKIRSHIETLRQQPQS